MDLGFEPKLVRDTDFFSQHYQTFNVLLNRFTQAGIEARHASDLRANLAEQIQHGSNIIAETLVLLGQPQRGGVAEPADLKKFLVLAERLSFAARQTGDKACLDTATELDKHISYFRSHIPEDQYESVIQDPDRRVYVLEVVRNCTQAVVRLLGVFVWACPDPRQMTQYFDSASVEGTLTPTARETLAAASALEGWCSPQKSLLLYSLVRAHKPKVIVEIGIYGGRSIVPMAAALKDNGSGHVYGIETWSGTAATSYRTNLGNDFWWMNIDFPGLKRAFLELILKFDLHETIKIVEASSDRCGGLFEKIDMLHIDGNHSTWAAAQDVINYVSKVPPGGIVVYDDLDWPSTGAGLAILRDCCQLLHVVPACGNESVPGCAAFVKI